MRELATIEKIDRIEPIEGADSIVLAFIKGWQCVALKEEFKVGDLCVYFEIDSLIPLIPQVEHLRARAYKKFNDKEWIRIKTIRLRGELSQGLALPVHKFFEMFDGSNEDEGQELSEYFFVGNDVSKLIGVEKYEKPMPVEMIGKARGNFPSFIEKTDQHRCQNLVRDIFVKNKDEKYEVSLKLDGTSFTAYKFDDLEGVCSRNMDLEVGEQNQSNKLIRMYLDSNLKEVLHDFGQNIAIQGELMGPGVLDNREGLTDTKLYVFNIYDIDRKEYMPPEASLLILCDLWYRGLSCDMIEYVPVEHMYVSLEELGINDISDLLKFAEGPSISNAIREGLIFKRVDGKFSFKVISNKYLLKEKD